MVILLGAGFYFEGYYPFSFLNILLPSFLTLIVVVVENSAVALVWILLE